MIEQATLLIHEALKEQKKLYAQSIFISLCIYI